MSIFYVLNWILFILFSVLPIIYLTKKFNIGYINPITITFFVYFPVTVMKVFGGPAFILDEGLFDPWFNFALLMTNIDLLSTFLITYFAIVFIKRNNFLRNKILFLIKDKKLSRRKMLFTALFFLLISFIFFVLLTSEFGFLNWVLSPREGYQLHRSGVGHYLAFSLLFLSLSYTIFLVYIKNNLAQIFSFIFFAVLVYFFGSKGFILSFFLFLLIVLWFKQSKYLKTALIFLTPLAFIVMLINFNPSQLQDVMEYFDYYVNSAMYYKAYFNGELPLFYGQIWWTDFYSYVPRMFFEDKPYVYGFLLVNEYFFPGAAEATNTPAFGGPIAIFADFGVLGVLFFSIFNYKVFLNTIFLYHLYNNKNLHQIELSSNNLFLFIWMLAPAFLVFFGTLEALILFFTLFYVVRVLNRIRF
jgi:hypothetical protein